MKIISRISFLILTSFLLNACSNNKAAQVTKEETPEALQDEHLEISKVYGKRSEDLVEKIYLELLNKDPEFQKLDADIRESKKHQTELENHFSEFDGKSSNYYSSASGKANAIKNALLKERMEKLISGSRSNYTAGVTELSGIIGRTQKNNITIDDYYTALKISVTLPFIEKFQTKNIPSQKDFQQLIENQKQLIGREDSLMNKK
jgi:hypothetical protein